MSPMVFVKAGCCHLFCSLSILMTLHQLGVGCFWKQHFVGALCYGDDVALLAPSPCALRLMLSRCYQFAQSHSLEFNADKTQLICFGNAVQCTSNVQFLGHSLKFCSTVQHLGHILSHDLSDASDIIDKTKELAKKANYMLHTFSCCDWLTKSTLFMSFCLSLSGSAIWSLACSQLKSLEVTFNPLGPKITCKIYSTCYSC